MSLFFRVFFIGLFITSAAFAQKDTSRSDMSFDFGWTRNRNVNIWPIFKRSTSKDQTDIQAIFTLFRYNKNKKAGSTHFHFLPLFLKDSNAQKTDLRLFSIYYPSVIRLQKDKIEQSRSFIIFDISPNINFLELTKSKDGLFVQNNLFFFLWYKNNQVMKRSHLVAFPLYWQYKNPQYQSYTFAPLFSAGHSPDSLQKHLMLTPFFWHFKSPEKTRNIFFPLVWNSKGKNNQEKNIIFPIYWSYKDSIKTSKTIFPLFFAGKNKFSQYFTCFPLYWTYHERNKHYKVVFPLVWKFNNPRYNSFTFLPLFSKGKSADSSKSHLTISPLFWHTKDGLSHRNILFPLWWNKKNGSGSYNIVFPLYGSFRNSTGNTKVFFPLVWNIKRANHSNFVFFPFFSIKKSVDSSESNFSITPLFWHKKTEIGYKNTLFPLWWNKSRGTGDSRESYNVVFPIYWSYKNKNSNSKVLFPLVWNLKKSHYHTIAFMPFFSIGHSPDSSKKHIGITPFFWHWENPDRKRTMLFPLWWHKTSGVGDNKDHYNVIFPIYWSYKNHYSNSKVLFPFIWNLKKLNYPDKAPYHTFTFMPFFSIGKSKDSTTNKRLSHFGITPFFWHYKYKDGYRNVLFPLWWNKKTGTGADEKYSNVVFPLYWSKQYKNKSSQVFFPLWWSTKSDTGENAVTRKTLFPLLWTKKDKNTNNVIAFPFLWSLKNRKYNSFTFFPVLSIGQSADKQKKHLITPLFCRFNNNQSTTKLFFPLWWEIKSDTGYNTVYRSGFYPFVWIKKDRNSHHLTLFPFIYSIRDKHYSSLTLFPLFSKGQSEDKNKNHFVSPLFWHFKNKDHRVNIFFPLYWNVKSDTGENIKRRTILFPLVWTNKDKTTDNTIILPFIYSLKYKTYQSFTLAPIFSSGHSPDRKFKHYAVTPLFWHFKTPAGHQEVLFPIFRYASDSAHNTKFNLLYFLLRYKGNSQYKSMHFIWPLCEYTKAPDQTSFRFAPILWYKKSDQLNYFSIQPFYYHSKSKEAERFNILWELFSYKHYFNQKKSVSFLWKVLFRDKYDNKDHEFRILYRLYANVNKEGNIEKSIFPLYHYTKTNDGGRSVSVFLKFYSSLSRPIADSKEFYKETKVFWFLRIRSNYDYLKQKGVKNIKP